MNAYTRSRAVLTGIALAASMMLSAAAPHTAFAANPVPPPETSTTKVVPRVSMARLNARIDKLPELASLKDGDLVTLYDDGSVTGKIWEGTYIWHPAGSVVQLKSLYARWKDGVVAVSMYRDPADATNTFTRNVEQPFATYIEQQNALIKRDNFANDPGIVVPVAQKQVTKRLVPESTDDSILRIPGNAFLFHKEDNGQYTTLTDALEFKSGGKPVIQKKTPWSNERIEEGEQPVGVMYQ